MKRVLSESVAGLQKLRDALRLQRSDSFAGITTAVEVSYLYRASARWITNRSGMVKAEAVELPLFFSSPPELKGEARQWTPEHYPLIPRLIFLA